MDNEEKIKSLADRLRVHLVSLYFNIVDNKEMKELDMTMTDEDDQEEEDFTYNCEVCEKMTMYATKPPKDYPLPLCLSDKCLQSMIV